MKTHAPLHLLKPCPGLSELREHKSHVETFTFLNSSKPHLLHTSPACHSIRAWPKALVWVQDYRRKPGASGAMRHVLNTFSICDGLLCWVGFYVGGSDSEASAMRETWVRSLGWEDPLEEEMATRSSILAWEIPGTEKPSGLQST